MFYEFKYKFVKAKSITGANWQRAKIRSSKETSKLAVLSFVNRETKWFCVGVGEQLDAALLARITSRVFSGTSRRGHATSCFSGGRITVSSFEACFSLLLRRKRQVPPLSRSRFKYFSFFFSLRVLFSKRKVSFTFSFHRFVFASLFFFHAERNSFGSLRGNKRRHTRVPLRISLFFHNSSGGRRGETSVK